MHNASRSGVRIPEQQSSSNDTANNGECNVAPSAFPVLFNGTYGQRGHSRNSSLELRMGISGSCSRSSQDLRGLSGRGSGHSRAASLDLRHARNSSADLNKLFRNDVGLVFGANGNSFVICE